jgi:putative endonuclease
MPPRSYFVYIMTNKSGTLYVGVTGNLERRVFEHRARVLEGFTKRYQMTRLLYYEETTDVYEALLREKQIKAWRRTKKVDLITSMNPKWLDLAAGWSA